ncbi:MAG: hypothetical protein QOH21_2137 [Acidobacteriota bacterium]|nr:hypothetical protein [Acidobacteriota bacterium]
MPIEVDQHGLMKLSARSPNAAALVTTFRNDAPGGRPVGYMNHTRAHLRIEPQGERPLNVHSGYWLKSNYNTLDIGPGESPMLIVAVTNLEDGARLFVPDDEREDSDHYEPPNGVGFDADEAKVHVKLVGGWDAQYVFEFDFVVKKLPTPSIEHIG